MIRHAALPVLIPAAILVIAAAMIPVRPARPIGTVLMSDLPNAEAAILVPIPVLPVPVAEPAVLPVMTRFMSVRPNAAQAVTVVRSIITLIPVRTAIRPQAALVITGMIPRQNLVLAVQQTVLATNSRLNLPSRHALIL